MTRCRMLRQRGNSASTCGTFDGDSENKLRAVPRLLKAKSCTFGLPKVPTIPLKL